MNNSIIIFMALLPAAILFFYIYRKDRNKPEPAGKLVKAFLLGLVSLLVSLCISGQFERWGLFSQEASSLWGGISSSFFGAAIPEEIAKFAMFWLAIRKNPYFDEKMDGIVYAVCVSLGFAAFENILYLFTYIENAAFVGVARAIFSVPGHFCFGILMGYYYSLTKFYQFNKRKHMALTLAAPILAHGIYNSLLSISNVGVGISFLLMVAFIYFCYKLWKRASKSIQDHIQRDIY